jgi:GTP-binding protein
MLVDDVKIQIIAGKGGDGVVAFNRTKMSLGPTGATGGKGGSVFVCGVSDLGALNQFRFKKVVSADNGKNGRAQFRDGHDAKDLILNVPVGTVIHNLTLKQDFEITKIGEMLLLAKGGKGGKGNFHFRSAINTSPKQFEVGKPGEEFDLRLELKMIADVGFIGLPNVGKSSLLNELTHSQSKVANYAFTTLEPNLGVYYDLILADIPGLIEGASDGKGLGDKFLRHIERTKVLFHFVSAEAENPIADYNVVRNELAAYNPKMMEKEEYILLSKNDAVDSEISKNIKDNFKKIGKEVYPVSIYSWESLEEIKKILNKIIEIKKEG